MIINFTENLPFQKRGKLINGILTSANLTLKGFKFNNEWGVSINNPKFLREIELSILTNRQLVDLNIETLLKIRDHVNAVLKRNPKAPEPKKRINLEKYLKSKNNDDLNYWLKPIGHTHDHVTEDRVFNQKILDLYFSKIKPSGVKIDDIIITFGIGIKKLLSYYKVTSRPQHLSKQELEAEPHKRRWPWFVLWQKFVN